MHFFDSNSIGTILTRFTKDINGLDDFVSFFSFFFMRLFFFTVTTCIIMIISAPFLLIIIILGIFLSWLARKKNYLAGQSLERLESKCRGTINTRFSSIMDGLMTVRAYNKQEYFLKIYLEGSDKVS